jgi:hypothetical protein
MARVHKIIAGIGVPLAIGMWISGGSTGYDAGLENANPTRVEYKEVNRDGFEDISVYNVDDSRCTVFYGLSHDRFQTAEQIKAEEFLRIEREAEIKRAQLERKYQPTSREAGK